ncbi:MAG: hypothetical protein P4K94_01890 [Terracidiphilus sp.]|nr:hypothetical protein [Terracidiphilus sp.]
MKTFVPIMLLFVFSTMTVTAMPGCATAEESGASSAAAPSSQEIGQQLEQTQKILREQSELMRTMHQEIERQGKEIESLRQRLPQAPTALTTSDATEGAARLQSAVYTLRAPEHAAVAQAAEAAKDKKNEPAELYFRIGNATFTPSGWVDFTAYMRSTDVGSGLGTNFQSIPFSNTALGGLSEFRLTAQSSRLGIRVDESVGKTKAYGYTEADFNGYQPSNAYVSTNSNTFRMRVYYLNLARGNWEVLGGQGWSLLTPTRRALSPFLADLFTTFHLDTSYQLGLTYARQTQLRFVYHATPHWTMGLSVEEPEQYSGGAATFPALFSNAETDIGSSTSSGGCTSTPNLHPDVIAKTTWDHNVRGLYWHLGLAGLLTPVRIDTPASVTKTVLARDTREGGGVVANTNLELFKGFHLITTAYWSDGGGRYIGGTGPGFIVLQQGAATAPFSAALIHSGSGIGGFEWILDKRTTIASYVSGAYFQRRFALDPSVKTPTYVGYGFPGSANTNNRIIREASFASISTFWQSKTYGALQIVTQTSYVNRAPWYVATGQPKDAHVFMEFMNLRYVLP